LPVVDADGRPLGILDVTDVVGSGLVNAGSVAWPLPAFPPCVEDAWTDPA
jgi:hypothetical protein